MIDELSHKIYNKSRTSRDVEVVDPGTVLLIGKVIYNLVKLVKKCRTPEETQTSLKSPRIKDRLIIRKEIRRQFGIKRSGEAHNIENAIISTSREMSVKTIQDLYLNDGKTNDTRDYQV